MTPDREPLTGENSFRALLESAPDAMVIVDHEGLIALVNAQTERVFGYDRHELLGKPVEMLMPDRYRTQHVDHRGSYFLRAHARPMGAGLELFGRRKDGSEFPVEISLSPLETDEGVFVASAIRDITDRKQAEQERANLIRARAAHAEASRINALLRRVRAMGDWGEQLPALAVTAHARLEDRERAQAAGFQAYLSKPIDRGRLLSSVSRLFKPASN